MRRFITMNPAQLRRIACLTALTGGLALIPGFARASVDPEARPIKIQLAAVANAADETYKGKVVSVTEGKDGKDGKLVLTDEDGKNEHTYPVQAKTRITLNKESAKLGDLKKGDLITVTKDKDDKLTAVAATRDAK